MKLIVKSVLLLGMVFVFSGCANVYGFNSLDQQVAKLIKKYSGLTPKPVNDPAYRWHYSSETMAGAVFIRIEGDHYEPMKRMLREMLGEPTGPDPFNNFVKYNLPKGAVLWCHWNPYERAVTISLQPPWWPQR